LWFKWFHWLKWFFKPDLFDNKWPESIICYAQFTRFLIKTDRDVMYTWCHVYLNLATINQTIIINVVWFKLVMKLIWEQFLPSIAQSNHFYHIYIVSVQWNIKHKIYNICIAANIWKLESNHFCAKCDLWLTRHYMHNKTM